MRGLPPSAGYEAGADTLRERIGDALDLGVTELTVYSLSTENLSRQAEDVTALTSVLARRVEVESRWLLREGVRVRFIGRHCQLPGDLTRQICRAQELTASNREMTLFLAINYGARAEILEAARRFGGGGEREFRRFLCAPEMHDPELVVRTGGERRLSNFLLWQSVYSELVFREELWPDFTRRALEEALAEFRTRRRRFGGR